MKYELIDSKETVVQMVDTLKKYSIIGFDLECENNLHHYGVFITIMQISVDEENYIVDVQALSKEDLKPLLDLLENPSYCKIFHDVSFDFRVLQDQFGVAVKGVFDSQLAAAFIGETNLGLGALLEKYFDVKKQRKYQMADWTKRPLTDGMLSYAIKDSAYLIKLKDLLEKKLIELDRLDWVKEEFKHLEEVKWDLPFQTYEQFPKFVHFTPEQRGAVKALFEVRDVMAQKVNRPIHFIMNNKKLSQVVLNPPSLQAWQNMSGVHPIVKNKAKAFHVALQKGLTEPIEIKRHIPKKAKPEDKEVADALLEKRNQIAKELGIEGHLLLSKEQTKQFVYEKDEFALRNWQKKLLGL